MKADLRHALETELNRLNSRINAIKVLLELPELDSTTSTSKANAAPLSTKTDGRSVRWQKASSQEKKRWINAIKAGRKKRKSREK